MSVGDFLGFGFECAKKHWIKYLLVSFLMVITLVVIGLVTYKVDIVLMIILLLVANICFSVGFFQNSVRLAVGELFDLKAFLPQPIVFLNFLIAMLIVWILTMIGTILLIIPGLIVQSMMTLVPYNVLHGKMSAFAAIKDSVARTKGHKMDIFIGFLVSNALVGLISATIIGTLFGIPLAFFISAYPYLRLSGRLDTPNPGRS